MLVDRSLHLPVAILGILTAGAAYVPVDVTSPAERIRYIIEDCHASAIVATSTCHEVLRDISISAIYVDRDLDIASGSLRVARANGARVIRSDNLAYVIYTSGSTGQPKGVCVTHANVVRLLRTTETWARFGPNDVWTMFHSPAFDFSVWEFWGALAYGGRLVITPYFAARSPADFYALLCTENVTILNQTPSAFRELMAVGGWGRLGEPPLRLVIFGGEVLSPLVLRDWWQNTISRPMLVNMYGITETTVHVTARFLTPEDLDSPTSAIGVQLSDLSCYLLDSQMQLVPNGVVGEIYVGGPGLARGYLDRPSLTSSRFVPDPYGSPGARLYRSGDLARRRQDGSLEFIGRSDRQVKIRGHRVELGEIEAVLRGSPGVRDAVVIPSREHKSITGLVGIVVPSEWSSFDSTSVRRHLATILPNYMMPALIPLQRLPLTRNGKLDESALLGLRPVDSANRLGRQYDELEERLARIWAELLNVPHIDPTVDFFDLGGHSILAARMMARIAKEFGRSVPISILFQKGTIESLATYLRQTETPALAQAIVRIRPTGSDPPLFCIHPAGGNVLCYAALAKHLPTTRPVYGLEAPGLDGGAPIVRGVPQLAALHLNAIREVDSNGPYSLLGWSFGGTVAYEVARQMEQAGARISCVILLDTSASMDGRSDIDDALVLVSMFEDLMPLSLDHLRSLSNDDRIRFVVESAMDKHLIPRDFEFERARLYLEVYKANWLSAIQFKPLRGTFPVVLLRARERTTYSDDHTLGWWEFAGAGIEVMDVPGNHLSMINDESNLQSVAQTVEQALKSAFKGKGGIRN